MSSFYLRAFVFVCLGLLFWPSLLLAQKPPTSSPPLDDIAPIAPLPSVLRDLIIETSPSGLALQIFQGESPLSCKPVSVSPCSLRVVGYGSVQIRIRLLYKGLPFEFRRGLVGRQTSPERWLLPLPLSVPTSLPSAPTTLPSTPLVQASTLPSPPNDGASSPPDPRTLARSLTRPPPPSVVHKPLIWPWVVLGLVVASGVAVGIVFAVTTQDHLGFRCKSCTP